MALSVSKVYRSVLGLSLMGSMGLVGGVVPASSVQAATNRTGDVTVPTDSEPANTPLPGTTLPGNIPLKSVAFSCRSNLGQPTVMYQPESQPSQYYAWAVPSQMGGGWSPERRCAEIAGRLEQYRGDGLVEMTTGQENGYNTVCVTTDRNAACRIVFTVPRGQDPITTRDRVFQNLASADSGQTTQGVYTYTSQQDLGVAGRRGPTDELLNKLLPGLFGTAAPTPQQTPVGQPALSNSGGINLRPFLDARDGGTGSKLTQTVTPKRTQTPAPKKLRRRF
jgi:Circadian oscillating protein COP23